MALNLNIDANEYINKGILHFYKWFTLRGLLISLGIFNGILFYLLYSDNKIASLFLWLIPNLIFIFIWICFFYSPRFPKNKSGILIAISTDQSTAKSTFKEDFIGSLKRSIQAGGGSDLFVLKILPNYRAAGIDSLKKAQKVLRRFRARFMLSGAVKKRSINGKETFVLDICGIVSHKMLPKTMHEKFTKEFNELLPPRLLFNKDNQFVEFELTANIVDLVAKYIIGIALCLSDCPTDAIVLYKDIHSATFRMNTKNPVIIKIKKRLPIRFCEAYLDLLRNEYDSWLSQQGNYDLSRYGSLISELSGYSQNVDLLHLYKAIFIFLNTRDGNLAKQQLSKCRKVQGSIFLSNMAFLEAYIGDISEAHRKYKRVAKKGLDIAALNQIESFLSIVVRQEPEKFQLHFCLGFLNWKIKGDPVQARHDFSNFIAHDDGKSFQNEIRLAKDYVNQLDSE